MKFIQTHATGSDETAPYDVTDYKAKTVREFIDELIPYLKDEFGYIEVKRPGDFLFTDKCEHQHGIFMSSIDPEFYELEIKDVKCSGGWGRFDYTIFVK